MTPLAVFLHTMLVVSLGPLLVGLFQLATRGGGLTALLAPARAIGAGLRAPGQAPLGHLAVLALAVVAGLLIPLFSGDAVLGFLGDGFTALLLLTGLSIGRLPLRASTVLSAAASLWVIGALTGSTDLAQAFAAWPAGPATLLVYLGLILGVAPLMQPDASQVEGLDDALAAWTRGTLQLGWLALGMMAFPVVIPLSSWVPFTAAVALFIVRAGVFGAMLATITARWPKLPLAEIGLACSLLALFLVKLGL
ncbi:hypothetical protein D3C72_61350 [compost metagenome]